MIGKSVSSEEFQEVLNREKRSQEFRKRLEAELKDIKPGECLLYEAKEGLGAFAEMSLSFLVDKVGGLKMVTEGSRSYVYRSNCSKES